MARLTRIERCRLLREEIEAFQDRVSHASEELDYLKKRLVEKWNKLEELTSHSDEVTLGRQS